MRRGQGCLTSAPPAPPAKLVVVSLWWAEKLRLESMSVLPAKHPFLKWRDLDLNRGHHDFQLPSLDSNPFYCVH
jgi:hypothetical protein